MKHIFLCILICLFTSSCLPLVGVGVGAIASKHSSDSKNTQQAFSTNFQNINTERESHGLKPLDWCSEAYRFDKGWAKNDVGCAIKIKAYEAGNLTALNTPVMPESSPSSESKPVKKSKNTSKSMQ